MELRLTMSPIPENVKREYKETTHQLGKETFPDPLSLIFSRRL